MRQRESRTACRRGTSIAMLRAGGVLLLALLCAASAAAAGGLVRPDPALTPGAARSVPLSDLCAPREPTAADVSPGLAGQVLERYRLATENSSDYVIDHLVPRSLGGTDALDNLWPQSTGAQPWNASRKDELEWQLHFLVCRRALSLRRAQAALASDWIAAYARYIGAPSGAVEAARP